MAAAGAELTTASDAAHGSEHGGLWDVTGAALSDGSAQHT